MPKLLKKKSVQPAAPHIEGKALAGTGKTTTLCWGLTQVPEGISLSDEQSEFISAISSEKFSSARVTAFSKAIQQEVESRLPGIEVVTNHSFGKRTVYQNAGKHRVAGNKTWKLCEERFGAFRDVPKKDKKETYQNYSAVKSIVSICKANLVGNLQACQEEQTWVGTLGQIEDTCNFYSVDHSPKQIEMAAEILKDSIETTSIIDFDDMVSLPGYLGMHVQKADFAVVDEAQDMNRAQQWLFLNSCERGMTIGDVNQSIFGFAGADPESVARMSESFEMTPRGLLQLPLTETRRCGKAIVEHCQQFVPEFRAHQSNPEGSVTDLKWESLIPALSESFANSEDFMVLCRTNAPLTSLALQLLKNRLPVVIKGKAFAQGLLSVINRLCDKWDSVEKLLEALGPYELEQAQKIKASNSPDMDQKLVTLADKIQVIKIFCEGCKTVECVIEKFDNLFDDATHPNKITLSSAHRSKGLEADKIFIIKPEFLPHPKIAEKSEFNRIQEQNLAYVACSRAKQELIFVQSERKDSVNLYQE